MNAGWSGRGLASRAGWGVGAGLMLTFSAQGWAQNLHTVRDIAAAARSSVATVYAKADDETVAFGSAFLIRSDGVLVTNRHVIEGADTLSVELESGEVYDTVYVLGDDPRRDLTVLQIPALDLPALNVGDDHAMEVGDPVYVLGNPLGLSHTFSDGLLSAKRTDEGVVYLQITAPISQGSSGGPVLNAAGEVVGVATMMMEDGQNLNLAVPARYADGLLAMAGEPVAFTEVASDFTEMLEGKFFTTADVLELMPEEVRAKVEEMEPWERQVAAQLYAVASMYGEEGWAPIDESAGAYLGAGDLDAYETRFRSGTYRAVGVCDDDCADLDLYLLDGDDEEIARDIELDALPVVEFHIDRRAKRTIAASMESCTTETCLYAMQIYRKE
jgi:hypothetical protein